MIRRVNQNVAYYQSALLPDAIIHAVTTRHGGVSPAPFQTLNTSITAGDHADHVAENLARLHRALELNPRATVSASQAQANRVARVEAHQRGTRLADVDALITNTRGVTLMLRFADCVPVFFYDAEHQAIGLAHAGWRGTLGRVVVNTVRAMGDAFGTNPRDLRVCLGPSIGPCCYAVGAEVIAPTRAAFDDSDALLIPRNGAVHLDLWQANARQLHELGVENVEVAGLCTAERTDEFYSWRRENARTGRFAAVIAQR
jgi:YfiH family protein